MCSWVRPRALRGQRSWFAPARGYTPPVNRSARAAAISRSTPSLTKSTVRKKSVVSDSFCETCTSSGA